MKVSKKSIKMAEAMLMEDTVNDLANDENTTVVEEADEVYQALDEALAASRRAQKRGKGWQNVLLEGEAGIGKTDRVKSWAKARGINIVEKKASTMDETDLGGLIGYGKETQTADRYASTELDELDNTPNSVLFLDELNGARPEIRKTLQQIILDHQVPDPRVKGGMRLLKNWLFTIAAINPADTRFQVYELDDAERGRFRNLLIPAPTPTGWFTNYYFKFAENDKELFKDDKEYLFDLERKLELAKTLTSHKDFKFNSKVDIEQSHNSGNGLVTNPRNLANLLETCNGTKDDLLNKWNEFCNSLDKPLVERILRNYVDKDDKANDALKYKDGKAPEAEEPEEEDVFSKGNSEWDKVANAFGL